MPLVPDRRRPTAETTRNGETYGEPGSERASEVIRARDSEEDSQEQVLQSLVVRLEEMQKGARLRHTTSGSGLISVVAAIDVKSEQTSDAGEEN